VGASHGVESSPPSNALNQAVLPVPVLSPDGGLLAIIGTNGGVTVWDVRTGRQVASISASYGKAVTAAFSPDGTTLAVAYSGRVRLWNLADGPARGATAAISGVGTLAFSPDGRTLAAATGSQVFLLGTTTGRQLGGALTGSSAGNGSLAFGPEGKLLAVGGENGTAQVWDVSTRQPVGVPLVGDIGGVASVAFSPDGRTLVTGGDDGTARLWTVAAPTVQAGRTVSLPYLSNGFTLSASFGPEGNTVATTNEDYAGAQIWDLATGQLITNSISLPPLVFKGRKFSVKIPSSSVSTVAFSRDGKLLAAGQGGFTEVWVLDAATGKVLSGPFDTTADLLTITFSPDGKTLAVGNGTSVQLWDIATGKKIGKPFVEGIDDILSIAFSPDGGTLATASGSGVLLWSTATGQQVGNLTITGMGDTDSVAFSPDGTLLATGSQTGTIRLWDVSSGKQVGGTFAGDPKPVISLAFSPDGDSLASFSTNGKARRWDTTWAADPLALLCARAGGPLTAAEWKTVAPGIPLKQTCS
jgi:WD40 repeat protein